MDADTEGALRQILEERAINQVMQTYCHTMDYGPTESWVDCFTADGVFEVQKASGETMFRVSGRDELRSFIEAYPDGLPKYYKHLYLSPIFDVAADTARVESYVIVIWCAEDEPAEVSSFGRVNDVFVRTDDGWRIRERVALTEAFPRDDSQLISWSADDPK
jgi:hypothetical protein